MEVVLKFDTIEFMLEYAIIMRHVVRMMAEEENGSDSIDVQRWQKLTELVYNAIEAALEHDPNKEPNWVKNHELHDRVQADPIFQNLVAFNQGRVTVE